MPQRLLYKEFEAIAIEEFSCEIQEGPVTHLTHRHDGVLLWTPVLDHHVQMHPRMIKKMCERLRIDLDEFKKYAPEAFLED